MRRDHKKMAGLYIHIPMCAQRCAYCDFYSAVGVDGARLVEALKREMTARRGFFGDGFAGPDTIYFGGGTPSLLTAGELQELVDCARGEAGRAETCGETTLEANPEDLTDQYLAALATTDLNRLSIGIQSFDDHLLRLMNRRHTSERARQAVRTAQSKGFDNISIDLIWGIPGMDIATWERTLDEALSLGVQHISAYHLTIEPGTPFGRANLKPIPEAESERQYAMLREKLSAAGFEQYEISNFALPGRRAVHNSAYWSGAPYLGIGPGAHSFDGRRSRSWVVPDVEKYLSGEVVYGSEVLTERDRRNEQLMVGLRTVEGVAATDELRRRAKKFLNEGLLVERPVRGERNGQAARIAIPPEKFLLSDYIISGLFE